MTDDNKPNNEHLRSYISYYNSLKNPKYAVLVKGEWGVGKTHLINKILKDDEKFYVSLFGLTTIQEVHAAVFVKMYPTRSRLKKIMGWFGNSSVKSNDITLAFGPLIGNIANALIKEKVDNTKPIIFDDLERCTIDPKDLFGAINKYVEHHECKVIVIAHDDKLNEELIDKKEKIIGQVIKVNPDIEDAFNDFISKSKAPVAFGPTKDIIYNSFLASGCKSLRILHYMLNDCARLLSCIPQELYKNKYLLSEFFTLFTALNINYRLGKLREEDIFSRNSVHYYIKKDKKVADIFDEIKERYNSSEVLFNIESDLLSNEILIDTIVNGLYNKEKIVKCINESRHFIKPESKGPWFTILNFDTVDTEIVDKAISDLESEFDNMQITEKGELLHSINVLFMLSDANHINKNINEIYDFFIEYVKRLQNNNKFPPADLFTEYEPLRDSAYGYGFWINDSYRHLSAKLHKVFAEQQQISLRKKYPSFLAELKQNLIEDTDKFCEQISRNGIRDKNTYGYIDILSGFKPHEFVDLWLSIETSKRHAVRSSLVNRYSAGSLRGDLADEKKWLKSVKMNIRHRASKKFGIDRLKLSRLLMGL